MKNEANNLISIKNNIKIQKQILIALKFLKKIMVIFSTIFLNVYIYKSLEGNFNLYLIGIIVSIIFAEIFSIIIFNIISEKNHMIIYRLSFVLDAILIVLVIIIKSPTLPVIFVFYALQEMANACFYGPHEIGEMSATNNKNSSNFLMFSTIITSIASIISPFLNGIIIEKISYVLLFSIIGVIAIIMFILSLFMQKMSIPSRKLQLKQFNQIAFKMPHVKYFYLSFTFFRFSTGGTIYTILPVVLFIKTGSEFSLGTYSSLFALSTIITLSIFLFIKKNNFIPPLCAITLAISCIMLIFWSTFTAFIIFNLIYYTFGKLYENEIFAMRLNTIKTENLQIYKKEHHVMYDIFANIGYIIGYLLIYLFINVIKSTDILTIVIGIMGTFIIISMLFLYKAKKEYSKFIINENKQNTNSHNI